MSELEELLATLTVDELRERILEASRACSIICMPKELDAFAAAVRTEELKEVRGKSIKETTFTNGAGVICLAYVIPVAILDPEEMSEAHKKLVAWAMIGSLASKEREP